MPLRLVVRRGQLMQTLPAGVMLAVGLPEAAARRYETDAIALAAVNAPQSCVLAGPPDAMAALEATLAAAGVAATRLETSHAFHSAMMEPILAPFGEVVSKVTLRAPSVPYVSNVTGRWITAAEATDPRYWVRHVRETVRVADGVAALVESEATVLLEVGPGRALGGLVGRRPAADGGPAVVASLPDAEGSDAVRDMQAALAQIWTSGVDVDWNGYWGDERRRRVPLPTYPFERQRYWADPVAATRMADAPAVPAAASSGRLEWFATPVWRQSPADRLPKTAARAAGTRWLLLADEQGLGSAMAERLTAAGDDVLKIIVGGRFARLSARSCVLDPSRPDDWAALVSLLQDERLMPDRVAHLWTVTARDMPISDASGLQRVRRFGFESLLLLLQAFGDRCPDAAFRLGVVTSHTHEITGGDGRFPEKATVLGPVRVISRERPSIVARAIDVEAPADTAAWTAVAAQVIDEFDVESDEDLVAYRGGRRWTQAFEPVRLDASAGVTGTTPGLRPGGTYLVTGGLGGVGLSLAGWLAGRVRPRLVLTSRRGLPPREQWDGWLAAHGADDRLSQQMTAVRALEAAGAEVMVAAVDVTSTPDMREVLDTAVRQFGPLAGVIHAAGVPGGGLIQLKTVDAAARVLAPKVEGMRVLDALLKRHTPDFIALCSSVASLIGEAGQIDYCAANAYLDAYAQSRAADPLTRVVAIDWDTWRDVGMAVATPVPDALKEARAAALASGISPSEGGEAFARILASRLPQVVVSPRLDQLHTGMQPSTSAGGGPPERIDHETGRPRHARPDLATAYREPATEVERQVAGVWEALLGIAGLGLDDHFFDLGGDSLLATQIIARLRTAFDVQLSLREVLERPTIAQLAALIEPDADGRTQLLAELEEMSDEEAEARLRELTRPPDA